MAYSIQYGSHIAILHYKLVTPPVELVTDTHNNNKKLYTFTLRPALVVTLPLCIAYLKKLLSSRLKTSLHIQIMLENGHHSRNNPLARNYTS